METNAETTTWKLGLPPRARASARTYKTEKRRPRGISRAEGSHLRHLRYHPIGTSAPASTTSTGAATATTPGSCPATATATATSSTARSAATCASSTA